MSKKNPPKRQELTQAESQQLLAILRGELQFVSDGVKCSKLYAAVAWKSSDREHPEETEEGFDDYCFWRKYYKIHSKRQKTLVNLITKLKTQR